MEAILTYVQACHAFLSNKSCMDGSKRPFKNFLTSRVFMTSEKLETKWEKLKTTASTKSEKPLVFLTETENQMTIEGNPKNRRRHQDRKTTVVCCETQKTRLKNGPNQTTENPNVPLLKVFLKKKLYLSVNARLY